MWLIHLMERKWKLKQGNESYLLSLHGNIPSFSIFHIYANTKIRYLPAIWQFFLSIAGNEGRVWFSYNLVLFKCWIPQLYFFYLLRKLEMPSIILRKTCRRSEGRRTAQRLPQGCFIFCLVSETQYLIFYLKKSQFCIIIITVSSTA